MAMVTFLPDPVQYQPGKSRDKETTKRMRAHVAEHLRKKRLQINQKPPKITPQKESAFDRTFCLCIVTTQSSDKATTSAIRKSRKQEAIADSYKICPRCLNPQFTELSRPGQLEIAKQRLPSVTPFLEVDFDLFQGLPELSSFKHSESTSRELNEFKARVITSFSYAPLRNEVLPAAAQTPALFWGILYSVCATLSVLKGGGESPLSMAIKHEAIRQINTRVRESQGASLTIASIAYFSAGILVFGPPDAANELQAHETGMMLLLTKVLNWEIEESDIIGRILFRCLALHNIVRAATSGIPLHDRFVMAFCQSTTSFTESDFIVESPLFCPRADFFTLRELSSCSSDTLRILRNVRTLVDYVLGDDVLLDYSTARADLVSMPPLSPSLDLQRSPDYIYESVRLASLLFLQALDTQIPFAYLSDPTNLLSQLHTAMQKTDIGNYWGNMSGVLFWVTMTGCAAAVGREQHPYMSSVLARGNHELTYRNPCFESATIAAWRFQKVHLMLMRSWEERISGVLEGVLVA